MAAMINNQPARQNFSADLSRGARSPDGSRLPLNEASHGTSHCNEIARRFQTTFSPRTARNTDTRGALRCSEITRLFQTTFAPAAAHSAEAPLSQTSMESAQVSRPPEPPLSRSEQTRRFTETFSQQFRASDAYNKKYAELKERYPALGPADGTPLGTLLSQLDIEAGAPHGMPAEVRSKSDLHTGDILIAYEPEGSDLPAHRVITLRKQSVDHNGISAEINQGDPRNVHAAIATQTKGNPVQKEPWGPGEPEVVEARAARNWAIPINRVQPTAISAGELGNAKVYRPLDPHMGDVMAQNAMVWAKGANISYSMRDLSDSMAPHRLPSGQANEKAGTIEFNKEAQEKAVALAEDAFDPEPKWALNPENLQDRLAEGASCSTFIFKNATASRLRVLHELAYQENKDPLPNLKDSVPKLDGFYAVNPVYVSPRTAEHLLLHSVDKNKQAQFAFVGKIKLRPGEESHAEAVPPQPAKLGPALAADDPRSNEALLAQRARASGSVS